MQAGKYDEPINLNGPPIVKMQASAFRIPTATPESDGTLEWIATTLVLVEAEANGKTGIGFSYADTATARLINDKLADVVIGCDALSVGYCWQAMVAQVRNLGRPGICSMAISAVDNALWDLKARLLEMPLVSLLGQVRAAVPVYGSGGFTSCSVETLQKQLVDWINTGITQVKMKIGREPDQDVFRVAAVLCQSLNLPLSSHCAPSIYVHPCCAAQPVRHLEYFYDHVCI
ncbi:MAG: hypothetical protein PHG00_01125 [Methylococcales bacterium]|nr:hypothetical protein [Methylococcales bacterium]